MRLPEIIRNLKEWSISLLLSKVTSKLLKNYRYKKDESLLTTNRKSSGIAKSSIRYGTVKTELNNPLWNGNFINWQWKAPSKFVLKPEVPEILKGWSPLRMEDKYLQVKIQTLASLQLDQIRLWCQTAKSKEPPPQNVLPDPISAFQTISSLLHREWPTLANTWFVIFCHFPQNYTFCRKSCQQLGLKLGYFTFCMEYSLPQTWQSWLQLEYQTVKFYNKTALVCLKLFISTSICLFATNFHFLKGLRNQTLTNLFQHGFEIPDE